MDVKNRLSAIGLVIGNQPVAAFSDTLFSRHLRRRQHNLADQVLVRFLQFVESRDVLTGNKQHMRRRLWVEIAKRQHIVGLMNDIRLNFTAYHFAKNTIVAHIQFPWSHGGLIHDLSSADRV